MIVMIGLITVIFLVGALIASTTIRRSSLRHSTFRGLSHDWDLKYGARK